MFGLGPFEILAIGVIAVMLYGKRLPEVGKTLGKSLAELRRQWTTISRDLDVAGQLDERGAGSVRQAIQPLSRYDEDESAVSGPVFDAPQPPSS